MRGLKCRNFVAVIDVMEAWLKNDRVDDKWHEYRKLAYELAIRGYDTPAMMDGCRVDEFSSVKIDTIAGGVLQRAIMAASEIGKIKRRRKCEMLVALADRTTIEVNAKEAAEEWLDPKKVTRGMEKADEALEKMAISTERPTMMINDLGQASQTGQDVQSPLMSKCLLTMLEAKKASIPAVRSAIRSWHAFAATVIMVPLANTLQPVCSLHVMMWLVCLKNHGTAQNHYWHLVFFVKFMGGGTSWIDDRMELYMKGRKKMKMSDLNIIQACHFPY